MNSRLQKAYDAVTDLEAKKYYNDMCLAKAYEHLIKVLIEEDKVRCLGINRERLRELLI